MIAGLLTLLGLGIYFYYKLVYIGMSPKEIEGYILLFLLTFIGVISILYARWYFDKKELTNDRKT
jgi:uncharacterized membrane protein